MPQKILVLDHLGLAVGPIFDFSAKIRKKSTIYIFDSTDLIFLPWSMIFLYVVPTDTSFHQKKKNCKYLKNCNFFIIRVLKTHFWTVRSLGQSNFLKIWVFWNLQEQSFLTMVFKNCQKKFLILLFDIECDRWSKFEIFQSFQISSRLFSEKSIKCLFYITMLCLYALSVTVVHKKVKIMAQTGLIVDWNLVKSCENNLYAT